MLIQQLNKVIVFLLKTYFQSTKALIICILLEGIFQDVFLQHFLQIYHNIRLITANSFMAVTRLHFRLFQKPSVWPKHTCFVFKILRFRSSAIQAPCAPLPWYTTDIICDCRQMVHQDARGLVTRSHRTKNSRIT